MKSLSEYLHELSVWIQVHTLCLFYPPRFVFDVSQVETSLISIADRRVDSRCYEKKYEPSVFNPKQESYGTAYGFQIDCIRNCPFIHVGKVD